MDEFLDLFVYNAWANRIILDAAARLPDEQYLCDLKSSFGGVHGTLCHMVWVEQVWLHRWMGRPNPAVAQGKDLRSLEEVRERWAAVEAQRGAFVATITDERLAETRLVKPSSGGEYIHTFRQMFRHFINHSAYHRGQIVTFLRQLGHSAPSTDLIVYYRQHQ